MKIKVGDIVVVISGSRNDKAKKGKVLKAFRTDSTIIVEGVNLKKKVSRDAQGKKSLVSVEFPVHVSNVAIFDEKTSQPTRIGYKTEGGKKVRVSKKSGSELK